MEEAVAEEAAAAAVAERRARACRQGHGGRSQLEPEPSGGGVQAKIVSRRLETNCNWVRVFFSNLMSLS